MSETVNVRGTSDSLFEGMTKEQIITAIEQATGGIVGNLDDGYITIWKEQNAGIGVKLWVGTTAQYNALEEVLPNILYIRTDDSTVEDMLDAIETIQATLSSIQTGFANYIQDSNWQNVTVSSPWAQTDIPLRVRKIGKVVYVRGRVIHNTGYAESRIVGTIPSGYRPSTVGAYDSVYTYSGDAIASCIVNPTGVIQLSRPISLSDTPAGVTLIGKTMVFDFSYLVDET